MRRRMLLLVFLLLALLCSFPVPRAEAGYVSCPICTTYADGSECCVGCICDGTGRVVACTNHYCPPADGGGD